MDESLLMHKLQAFHRLSDEVADFFFLESVVFLQHSIDVTFGCVLSDDVEIVFFLEKTVEINDILMLQAIVDSNLLCYLVFDLFLSDNLLADDLQGA